MITGKGKNMIDTILELLFYAVFPFLRRKKQRREEWTGFLEEIRETSGLSLAEHKQRAVFRTDEGKRIVIKFREQDSARYQKGIRYRKKAGEDFPEPCL
jgi:hypothetical protein